LVEHLVMAEIPKTLDGKLSSATMPDPDWWRPIGRDFPKERKLAAVWSRYAVEGIEITVPNEISSGDFKVREIPARQERKGRRSF
jgi:hypothetical protein